MDQGTEVPKADRMSVPAFGEWERQQGLPDYSLDFSKIRQMRKQNKSDYTSISVGNDEEMFPESKPPTAVSRAGSIAPPAIHHHHHHSPSGRKKIRSYFVCCIGA